MCERALTDIACPRDMNDRGLLTLRGNVCIEVF
jgi:hypothetical protein